MAVPHLVLGLEPAHQFHVLAGVLLVQQVHPVRNRLAVGLLDGREIRGRSLDLACLRHGACPFSVMRVAACAAGAVRAGRQGQVRNSTSLCCGAGGSTTPVSSRSVASIICDMASSARSLGAVPKGSSSSAPRADRKSTRLNSSHLVISYAVFCLKKKKHQRSRSSLSHRPRATNQHRTIPRRSL